LTLLLATMVSCGNKGPLKLEPERVPPPVQGFSIRQIGSQIQLEWIIPDRFADQTPLLLEEVGRIFIHCAEDLVQTDKFLKKSDIVTKIPLKQLEKRGNRNFTASYIPKLRSLKDKTLAFAITYEYGKKRAEPGPVLSIKPMPPTQAVSELKLKQEKKAVIITWAKPTAVSPEQPEAIGYHVYRRIKIDQTAGTESRLTVKAVPREYYEDLDTGTEGEYLYRVTAVLAPLVESEPSIPAAIAIIDRYPPEIPRRMVAFSDLQGKHVLLTWQAVPDTDLDHYRIYRKDKPEAEFQLLADQVTDIRYSDTRVKKEQIYYYAISAVDHKGNESPMSAALLHEFH